MINNIIVYEKKIKLRVHLIGIIGIFYYIFLIITMNNIFLITKLYQKLEFLVY